jgi:hypothetical protein
LHEQDLLSFIDFVFSPSVALLARMFINNGTRYRASDELELSVPGIDLIRLQNLIGMR